MARRVGRPNIEIDKVQFEKLCSFCCTTDEISHFFDCATDTIERWCKRTYGKNFEQVRKQKVAFTQASLRRTQLDLASKGNVTMLIWLGKQLLNQRDQPMDANSVAIPAPVYSIAKKLVSEG